MFRNNTTFVIGAGASAEFGLPVGWQLAKRIKSRASCHRNNLGHVVRPLDPFVDELLRNRYQNEKEFREAVYALDAIHEGIRTAVSIDAFIDRFQNNPYVATMGKLLIAIEIAEAESNSLMHTNRASLNELEQKTADDTWIGSFVRILLDGVKEPDDVGKNINIICFNYDRCIEYYLAEEIGSAYDIAIEDAEEIVSRMNIIHPYGTLGKLPWVKVGIDDDALKFGPDIDLNTDWFSIAQKNIRTYTEQTHDINRTWKIHNAIGQSNVLVFLGFGFNNQNLDLLRVKAFPEDYDMKPRNVYSTGKGIERQVANTLRRRIGNLFGDYASQRSTWDESIHIEHDKTCGDLFYIHNMNLSQFIERYSDHDAGILRDIRSPNPDS